MRGIWKTVIPLFPPKGGGWIMGIIVWGQEWCRGAEKGMMANRVRLFLVLFLFGIILSCAPVISPELRAKVDPDLTFKEVLQNPDAYKGKLVIWGGEIKPGSPSERNDACRSLRKTAWLEGKTQRIRCPSREIHNPFWGVLGLFPL